jgi:hypothetical protein
VLVCSGSRIGTCTARTRSLRTFSFEFFKAGPPSNNTGIVALIGAAAEAAGGSDDDGDGARPGARRGQAIS